MYNLTCLETTRFSMNGVILIGFSKVDGEVRFQLDKDIQVKGNKLLGRYLLVLEITQEVNDIYEQ